MEAPQRAEAPSRADSGRESARVPELWGARLWGQRSQVVTSRMPAEWNWCPMHRSHRSRRHFHHRRKQPTAWRSLR
jgi:hypothetical protein